VVLPRARVRASCPILHRLGEIEASNESGEGVFLINACGRVIEISDNDRFHLRMGSK
jgi:hypothetical protein